MELLDPALVHPLGEVPNLALLIGLAKTCHVALCRAPALRSLLGLPVEALGTLLAGVRAQGEQFGATSPRSLGCGVIGLFGQISDCALGF